MEDNSQSHMGKTTITNQNCIHDAIKGGLNSQNACHYPVYDLIPSCSLSKYMNTKTNSVIILPVLLYGCEIGFFTPWEEHGLRVLQNGVLRKLVGPEWDKVTGKCERTHNEELHEFRFSPNLIWLIKARRMICVGYVARVEGEERYLQGFSDETSEKETTWKTQAQKGG